MATATPIDQAGNMRSWRITDVTDNDTGVTINHGLNPTTPDNLQVFIEPRSSTAYAAGWYVALKSGTQVGIGKIQGPGTGLGGPPGTTQIVVTIWDPHSIVQ